MGIAAGRLALAFRGLKALALRGERSSHCSSYLPIRAFLIIASNPMLVLEFSWTDWLLQLISPGRYGRGRREGTGGGREPHEKTDGGDGERGRKETREKGRNKQSAHSRKATNFVILFFKALRCTRPPPPRSVPPPQGLAGAGGGVGWDSLWDLGFWGAVGRQGSQGPRAWRMEG